MENFYEFRMNIPLIEDLPSRVAKVLKCITGVMDWPDDLELPNHKFFECDWRNVCTAAYETAYLENRFQTLCVVDMAKSDMCQFLEYIFPYMKQHGKPYCIGTFRKRDEFPNLIEITSERFSFINTADIFASDSPILIDPKNRQMIALPKSDDLEDAVNACLERMMKDAGMTGAPIKDKN